MKIFGYEWYKIIKQKIFPLFLLLLVGIDCLYFIRQEMHTKDYQYVAMHKEEYQQFYDKYSEMEEGKREQEFSNAKDSLSTDDMTMYYMEDFTQQWNYQKNYKIFLDEMHIRMENMLKLSAFNGENSFSKKNIEKTTEDFSKAKKVNLELDNNHGLERLAENSLTDYFCIFLLFLLCIELFYRERESGIFLLVKTKENGRIITILSKFLVLFIGTAGIAGILYGSNLILCNKLYGYGSLNRPIQSMPSFRNCIHTLTVGQYLGGYLFIKILSLCLISAIFSMLFLLFRNKGAIYGSCLLLLGAEAGTYLWIPEVSILNYFKFINLFYFLNPQKVLGTYYNLNFFGQPVEKTLCYLIAIILVLPLLVVIGCIVFCVQMQCKEEGILAQAGFWIRRHLKILSFGHTSLVLQEITKFLVQGKGIIPIALMLWIGVSSVTNAAEPYYGNMEDAVYGSYMKTLEGEVTEATINYINMEQARFGNYFPLLGEKMATMTEEELKEVTKEIEPYGSDMEYKSGGLRKLQKQYDKLTERMEKGEKVYLVNKKAMESLFKIPEEDIQTLMEALICMVFLLGILLTSEFRNGMYELQCTTSKGRGILYFWKSILAIFCVIFSFSVFYVPKLINFLRFYGTKGLGGAIQDIPFAKGKENMEIGKGIIGIFLFRLALLLLAAGVMLYLSVKLRNTIFTIIIGAGLSLIPCLAVYNKNNIRISHQLLNGTHGGWLIGIGISMGFLIFILFCAFAGWKYIKVDKTS